MPDPAPQELREHVALMRADGIPDQVIAHFERLYRRYRGGETGRIPWEEIAPPQPGDIVEHAALDTPENRQRGAETLDQLVVIELNGGLGTTMALHRAKSLIPVRGDLTFLDLIAQQIEHLRATRGARLPLLLMNSFRTSEDTRAAMAGFAQPDGLPIEFVQNRFPRILRDSGLPATGAGLDTPWAPPGHGDVYLSLELSGVAERLERAGYRWLFLSNSDNLAATVDLPLLGYLDASDIDFAMEVTPKTPADRKGGTLVRHRGRLTLLESAQVEPGHEADFQDIERFTDFNTNNLWVRLGALRRRLRDGRLDLPMIVNPKRQGDVELVQLETAMGAAIGCFERASGVRVPRSRFSPVKGTSDLLAVRSDAYARAEDGSLHLDPARDPDLGPPHITLERRYYGALADLDSRIPEPVGLLRCRSLTVEGDVRFGSGITVEGDVTVRNASPEPREIPDGTTLRDRLVELG